MHRFYLREGDSVDGEKFVVISEELVHQWTKVLRFRVGEEVILFDGQGNEFVGEIVAIHPRTIEGKVLSNKVCDTELSVRIILAQSILKNPEKFEWILQKGTELGVSEFYPLITRRTERESLNKIDRLQRILIEATEQCGGCKVPILHEPIKFEKFLKLEFVAKKQVELIVPHVAAADRISDVAISPQKHIVVCIGPEGGFDDAEVQVAYNAGGRIVSLGKRVLRSETASLSAVVQLATRSK